MPPLIDYSVWATWQKLYNLQAAPEYSNVRLSYHRAVLYNTLAREMADACVTKLNWQPTQRIAVFGCGFGWMVEHLEKRYNFSSIIGIDTSTFIQANKLGTEEADINAAITLAGLSPLVGEGATLKGRIFDGNTRARTSKDILNEDGASGASRTRIRQALGGGAGNMDIVMTEHVLESWSDADCVLISNRAHQLGASVQHFVMTLSPEEIASMDPEFQVANWKPNLGAWKTLLPNDIFIAAGSYEVL